MRVTRSGLSGSLLLLLLGVSLNALAQPSLTGTPGTPMFSKKPVHCAPRYTQAELDKALQQVQCSAGVTTAFLLTDVLGTRAQAQQSVAQALRKGGFTVSPAFHLGPQKTLLMVTIPHWAKQTASYPAAALLNPIRVLLLPAGPKLTSVFFESMAAQLVHTPAYPVGLKLDQRLEALLHGLKGSEYTNPAAPAPGKTSPAAHP